MLKICDSEIVRSLSLIIKNCIRCTIFPNISKKSNLAPVHKKGNKKIIKSYRPISNYQFVGRYLKGLFLIRYLSFLAKANYFSQINLVSDRLTLMSVNCYQLFIVFIRPLIIIHLLKYVQISGTYQEHLIGSGT